MTVPLPSFPVPDDAGGSARLPEVTEHLTALVRGALDTWTRPQERRRMRLFGFRPAVEAGVLKREWKDLRVRVKPGLLTAAVPGIGAVSYAAGEGVLLFDERPFRPTKRPMAVAGQLVDLIESYERWVEAREGRDGRLSRGGPTMERRPYNALAETRRLRRIMAASPRRPARGA